MNRKLLLLFFLILWSLSPLRGQVTGISYTLSPGAEYVWWDDQAGLSDVFLVSGRIGIGFGEYLELRGLFAHSLNAQTNFSDFGLPGFADSLYNPRSVRLQRWGGELKVHFSTGKVLPYLTIGTGVQNIRLDSFAANEQIFVDVGLGLKISPGDRFTLDFGVRNTAFNFNAGRYLLTDADRDALGLDVEGFSSNRLRNNWSLGASLQLYLGGRRPGELSELDKAYQSTFSDGLRGIRFTLEPAAARLNVNDNLPYRNTWLLGGYAGIDFNSFIGIRGFYLQAARDNRLSFDFDDLALYGGELRLQLGEGSGLIPYLTIGGGYIDADPDAYFGRDSSTVRSQAFAMGGAGITLPLSDRLKAFGSARALLTAGTDTEAALSNEQVFNSWMYQFGLRFVIGRKAEKPQSLVQSRIDTALAVQQERNTAETEQLREKFEARITELETELNKAYTDRDIEEAARVLDQLEETELIVAEMDRRDSLKQQRQAAPPSTEPVPAPVPQSRIVLTPAELEGLIEEIMENTVAGQFRQAPPLRDRNPNRRARRDSINAQNQALERRITTLEREMAAMRDTSDTPEPDTLTETERTLMEQSAELVREVQKLREEIGLNRQLIDSLQLQSEEPVDTIVRDEPTKSESATDTIRVTPEVYGSPGFPYRGLAAVTGVLIGERTDFLIGLRLRYGIGQSPFEVQPEVFLGLTTPAAYGLSVNAVYPLTFDTFPVEPYFGLGGGFMQLPENDGTNRFRLHYNLLIGVQTDLADGRLFLDYTARNPFAYHQIMLGYRLGF